MEQQVESTATSTEANSASQGVSESAVSVQSDAQQVVQDQQQQQAMVEAYTPNFKFKVLDKEHEVDEFLRPVIKSKEHEAKIRELYEKAYGLDHVKAERENLKQYKQSWQPIVQNVAEANKYYQKAIELENAGDTSAAMFHFSNALKHLGIKDGAVKKYVFELMKQEDLSPEQKAEYNRRRQVETEAFSAQEQVQSLQNQLQTMAVSQRTAELNQVLSKPEIAQVAQAFDQKRGQNAFKNEIIRRGQMYFMTEGRDVPAEELASELYDLYGHLSQTPTAQSQSVHKEVPVIPVVKGGSQSPSHRSIESLDDLKKIRQQKFGY